MPVMIAPAALGKLLHPEGEAITVAAAKKAGVLQVRNIFKFIKHLIEPCKIDSSLGFIKCFVNVYTFHTCNTPAFFAAATVTVIASPSGCNNLSDAAGTGIQTYSLRMVVAVLAFFTSNTQIIRQELLSITKTV